MLKKSQSSTSEFANNALTTNMVKVGNYHRKSIDRVSTIFSDYDGIQQVIPFSSLERFQQFQAVKNGNAPLQYKPTLPVHYNTVQTERDVIVILNDHELTHLPSDALKNKTKVKTMDISQNKFSEFPMPVLQLTLLTSLRLDYNQLKAIPSEICRLVNLEYLTMSNNLIDKLPPTFTKLEKLKHLDLEGNGFTLLSQEITGLKNLECLNIVHNRFRTFSCGFKDLTRLVEFHFEWFRYTMPQLHIHQKRKDGEYNINKLRSKCGELHAKKISAMNFEDFVKVMSYEKVDLSNKDACGRTALHTAGVYGDRNVAEFLVTNYPQLIDEEDQDGMTALCLSLFGDKYAVTEYLLRKTANIKIGGGKHGSVLHIATKRRNLNAVKEIIKLGEDPNKLDAGGNSPLHYAFTALIDGHINASGIIQHLLDNGADPNIKNRENWSPVHMAVRKKNFAAIEWILSYNFEVQEIHGRGDIFKLNKQGGVYLWTSYHIATYSDSYEIVNALGEAKINPFKRSLNGFTAKRIVKKYGLTLKLVEKFEKEWVKQNILSKSAQSQKEGAVHLSLYNLNSAKEGNNASKNIFRDLMLGIKNHPNITTGDTTGFGYMLKPRMNVMRSTYSAVRPKKATDDSFEVEPEPDTDFDPENQNSDVVYMDYCSEINEEEQDCLSMLRAHDSNSIKTNKLPEGPPHQMKQFIKGKTDFTSNFQPVNLDLEAYEEKLESQGQFTIEFLSEEIKLLQENLVSSRVLVYEKMKILNAFKVLHRAIINHMYRSFDVPIEEDLLPFYIHDYNTNIAPEQKVCPLKATMAQISSFYELVPQALIEIFKDMPNKINEGFHLKKRICNALDDYKYFPAIAFLENLMDSPSENALVVREAGGCYKGIKAYFDSERHQEESREAYHRFLKRLYSKRPSTKKYLSPLMQLEKDI